MKRIILLAAFLLAASACTNTPPDNTNTTAAANTNATTNMTANANTSASPATTTGGDAIANSLISQEKQVYDAIKNKNSDSFGSMLADDFIYIADDGIHNKADTIKGIQSLNVTDTTLADWKVLMLDKDAAVVYYTETMNGTANGQPMPTTPFRASSAWVNRNGKWVAVFHQESAIKPPQTPPPSTNKPAAKASPGGMETMPMACTNDDATAREKMVWDDLKKKDSKGFASYLADDAIEIEPDAVYDKTGSVNTVTQFDFSKLTLSDFKAMNLDSDAQLVTYVVKGNIPGMGAITERHSTIWVKNNGSWLAKFHQGTTVAAAPATPAKK